jgi:hypothetical protein
MCYVRIPPAESRENFPGLVHFCEPLDELEAEICARQTRAAQRSEPSRKPLGASLSTVASSSCPKSAEDHAITGSQSDSTRGCLDAIDPRSMTVHGKFADFHSERYRDKIVIVISSKSVQIRQESPGPFSPARASSMKDPRSKQRISTPPSTK